MTSSTTKKLYQTAATLSLTLALALFVNQKAVAEENEYLENNTPPVDTQSANIPGTRVLTARLTPLNTRQTISGRAYGSAIVRIIGDKITVQVHGSGLDPSIMHMGHIHKGDRCPGQVSADANHDGVLDVIEGLPAYGPVLVNFGADISSLSKSAMIGAPMANAAGVLNYKGAGSYSKLVNDLHTRAAMDPATGIAKLAAGEEFKPEMGVIVIHGIRADKALPAATQTLKGSSPQMSLPVLCGRLYLNRSHAEESFVE